MLKAILDICNSTVFLTVISGVLVFIISQLITERVIKPRNDLKRIKGKIICYLTMHARYIANPLYLNKDKDGEFDSYWASSCDLRMIASELAGHIECYPIICNKGKYGKVVNNIIKISNNIVIKNSVRDILTDNIMSGNEFCKVLKIKDIF